METRDALISDAVNSLDPNTMTKTSAFKAGFLDAWGTGPFMASWNAVEYDMEDTAAAERGEVFSQQEFEAEYKDSDVKYYPGMSRETARRIRQSQLNARLNQFAMKPQGESSLVGLGGGLLGGAVDPVNLTVSALAPGSSVANLSRGASVAGRASLIKRVVDNTVNAGVSALAEGVATESVAMLALQRNQQQYGGDDMMLSLLAQGAGGAAIKALASSVKAKINPDTDQVIARAAVRAKMSGDPMAASVAARAKPGAKLASAFAKDINDRTAAALDLSLIHI